MQFQTTLTAIMAFVLFLAGPVTAMNGWATWYNQYGVAGSCGEYHSDGDFVAAVSTAWGHNSLCGRTASVNYGGRNIHIRIVDTCYACGQNDIDLSVAGFDSLADPNTGKIFGVEWDLI